MRAEDMLRAVRTKSWKQSVIKPLSSPLVVGLGATGAGEWLLYADRVAGALGCHLLALFTCLLAPLVTAEGDDPAVRTLALVPLFRVVNLGMPVFTPETLYWLPVVYGSLFPAVYVFGTTDDLPRPRWNVRLAATLFVPSVLAGAVVGHVEHALVDPAGLVPELTPTSLLAVAVVTFGFVALGEELVFRGLVQPAFVDRMGRLPGLVVTNLLFGAMHAAYSSTAAIGAAVLLGLAYSIAYEVTDSLLVTTTVHGTANVFLLAVVPLYGPLFPVG